MSTPEAQPSPNDHGSLWADAAHRLRANPAAMAGLLIFLAVAAFSLLGPLLTPYSQAEQQRSLGATPPLVRIVAFEETGTVARSGMLSLPELRKDWAGQAEARIAELARGEKLTIGNRTYQLTGQRHLLGTDSDGGGRLTRLMRGGRISWAVGLAASLVAMLVGVVYGATAGLLGGWLDSAMMRIVDILYSLPFTIFVILLIALFEEQRSLLLVFLVIGLVEWLTMARIVRGQVLHLKTQPFIEVARAYGAGTGRIIRRHLIPNAIGSVIVYTTLLIPAIIMFESFLSFLGLGVQPPNASWGTLIKEGADSMTVHPWLLIFPALIFSTTLLSLNFLGDGLRDALDPRDTR